MSICWIYELLDPRDNEVRYIGYTGNLKARYTNHINDKAKSHKRNWIVGLLRLGLKPIQNVIEECDSTIVGERERFWISEYKARGAKLVNTTNGGEGGSAKGRKLSDETRRRMSLSKKGIPFTPEHKLNLSISNKGTKPTARTIEASRQYNKTHPSARKGKHVSEESKRRMSIARTGKKLSVEAKECLRAIRANQAKEYPAFRNEITEEIIPAGKDLRQLCIKAGLHSSSMYRVVSGKLKSYKGWVVSCA